MAAVFLEGFMRRASKNSRNSRNSRLSRKFITCVVKSDCSNGLATSMRFCPSFQFEENPWHTGAMRSQSVVWKPKFRFSNSVGGDCDSWGEAFIVELFHWPSESMWRRFSWILRLCLCLKGVSVAAALIPWCYWLLRVLEADETVMPMIRGNSGNE